MRYAAFVLAGLGLLTGAVQAQQADSELLIDASACVDIVSPIERLACFEAQTRAASGAGSSGAAAPARSEPLPVLNLPRTASQPAPAQPASQPQVQPQPQPQSQATTATPTANAEDRFGLPEKAAEQEKKEELRGSIAELRETYPNQYMITLVNGQVWRQMVPERYMLQVGQDVRIYPTRWGQSYRLAVEKLGGYIQVERVK